jgi:protocatechuate 3,4-dioxygenase beta subunit
VEATTDDDGSFSAAILPGKLLVRLNLYDLPDRYFLAPDKTRRADYDLADGEATRTLAPLEVYNATPLKGAVLDEAGKPVSGVQVSGSATARRFDNQPIPGNTLTDERGEFVLGHIPPDSTVVVRGLILHRSEAEAVTVRVNAQGVQDGPILLRLVKKATVPLRGRVLGPEGRPVSGAQVKFQYRTGQEQNSYGYGKGEQTLTGSDGAFRTPDGVPVSEEYRAFISAAGMEEKQSDWVKASSGEFPDMTLRRTTRARQVTGRVINSEGKPVAGAEVIQSGDGPQRSSDSTNEEGRFTVAAVYNTPAFLFVKKDGYRFTGRRIGAGDEPVEIVVSKADGPEPAALKPQPSPLTRAGERAMARALVASAWQQLKPGVPGRQGPPELAPTLALVDTDRVIEMVENQILQADGPMIANVALGLYEDNPHNAVATLAAIRPAHTAAEALLDLFDKVPDTPADLRQDLLDRTLAVAREDDDSARRLGLTARVADRWFEAGNPEKGKALLAEARAAFKSLEAGASSDLRGELAEPLARVDVESALALLAGDKNEPRLSIIARKAAATDPAGAERVLGGMSERLAKLGALPDVCAGIAAGDLMKGVNLAANSGAPGVAALVLAAGARAKASDDPVEARALLARSYDRLEPLAGRMVVPSVSMARLLPLAVKLDPGRSSEYLWRAIAARPSRTPTINSSTMTLQIRNQYLALAQLAALVARYDREAAETIFEPVAENAAALLDDRARRGNEAGAILQATACFDARAAVAMLNAASVDSGRGTILRPGVMDQSRLAVARALALPPAVRLREALQVPGQPDLWPAAMDEGFTHPDARKPR